MGLKRLIYTSQPFGFDDAMLNGILSDARRRNPPDAITGALICRADVYLQLLEGPPEAVDAAYARIAMDDRHDAVTLLHAEEVEERLFGAWAMRDDPARSWMWSAADVAKGALARATRRELLAVFQRLADEPV